MICSIDHKEALHILKNKYVGHLAYTHEQKPFVIPITYFYFEKDHCIICYSREGHKINAMRQQPQVALQVAQVVSINLWKSVMIHGTYTELDGSMGMALLHEFSLGIKDIIRTKDHSDAHFIRDFSSNIHQDDLPIVFTISIDSMTAMRRSDE